MSISTCALSGMTLEHPVVSKKTGHIFEKRIIEKHIEATGQCPITGGDLEVSDLLDIQVAKAIKPRPLTTTDIPSILNILQSEWDILMLETYTLKQHLETVRQELSHALYQHDAACRVICRLVRERDEYREALASTQSQLQELSLGGSVAAQNAGESENCGLYEGLVHKMESLNDKLSDQRKKKQPSSELSSQEAIAKYGEYSSNPVHSSTNIGITALDIHSIDDKYVLTGGNDHNGVLFDWENGKILNTFELHKKRITCAKFLPIQAVAAILCSNDNTASLWSCDVDSAKYENRYLVRSHSDSITSCTVHPLVEYAAFGSKDQTWSFHNLYQGIKIMSIDAGAPIHSLEFHPDGLMIGAGLSNGDVKIWDIRQEEPIVSFKEHRGDVWNISFSDKGYYLASCASGDNSVKVWDLRKIQNSPHTIELPSGTIIKDVAFDPSGTHFALARSDGVVNMYQPKVWKEFAEFKIHKDEITKIKFGNNAKFFATVSLDRFLKIHK